MGKAIGYSMRCTDPGVTGYHSVHLKPMHPPALTGTELGLSPPRTSILFIVLELAESFIHLSIHICHIVATTTQLHRLEFSNFFRSGQRHIIEEWLVL